MLANPRTEAPGPTQRDAIDAALHGTPLERVRIASHAMRALMRDPTQTEKVFLIGLTLGRRQLPRLAAQFLASEDGNWLLENRPAIDSQHVDFDGLRNLPDGTLGREYMRFLDENGLDADFFQAPPGLPPMVRYMIQRIRQTHDLWHVVTGCTSDPDGEAELQGFYFGQTGMPAAALLALGGGLRETRQHPDTLARVLRAWRRGRAAAPLPPFRWERHWERPLSEVRAELGID